MTPLGRAWVVGTALLLAGVSSGACRLLSGEAACLLDRDCPEPVTRCDAPADGGVGVCVSPPDGGVDGGVDAEGDAGQPSASSDGGVG